MAVTYRRRFRVRLYECDALGHVNNVNYLRYMQEAAIEASAALGFDLAWYHAAGRRWLVRETEIEFLRPLRYGDTVEAATWVADFRRVRSRRAYELRSLPGGELAARARTDWVYLNTLSGEPEPIPPEMAAAFLPEKAAHGPPARRPAAPSPAPQPYAMLRRVRFQDIDMAQHVNNAVYAAYAEDCGFQAGGAFGWPPARMNGLGLAVILLQQHILYHRAAVLDDEIDIRTWIYDVGRVRFARYFALRRVADGAPLAEVFSRYALVERASLKPARFPPGMRADFAAHAAPPSADS